LDSRCKRASDTISQKAYHEVIIMKKKILTGIVFGMIAGIIDVIPMIVQEGGS